MNRPCRQLLNCSLGSTWSGESEIQSICPRGRKRRESGSKLTPLCSQGLGGLGGAGCENHPSRKGVLWRKDRQAPRISPSSLGLSFSLLRNRVKLPLRAASGPQVLALVTALVSLFSAVLLQSEQSPLRGLSKCPVSCSASAHPLVCRVGRGGHPLASLASEGLRITRGV